MLDVTVCILSYNRADYLSEAVASVLAQTNHPRDIAIFDNGSERGVYESMSGYLNSGVSWIGSDVTRSAIWNFRRAVAAAESKYVLVMHDDDRLCRDFLEKQIEYLESNPGVIAVACNGYIIDENSRRTGLTILANQADGDVELYECSAHVAMKYAGDSCIPFSSTVYRTRYVREIEFREEFGKVCDAVFFCDMADAGAIALNTKPLYECRVHPGQDSIHFPTELMEKLERFFWTRGSASSLDIDLLHKSLVKQHTSRIIRKILATMSAPGSLRYLLSEVAKVKSTMFSFPAALGLLVNVVKKRLTAAWMKSRIQS